MQILVLCLAMLSAAFLWAQPALAEDDEDEQVIEEVKVTGSYIRRDNFDLASPISVIDEVDIEEAATPNTADILWEQTFNIGTAVIANPAISPGGTGGESNQAAVGFGNIRGLGNGATLDLMDGKRLPFGDANFNYPQIAIQRVETLLDGASALYGTEAIAGVINYIPRKNFDGFKISLMRRDLEEISAPDDRIGLMFGATGDRASGMFALEYREKERVEQYNFERYVSGCRDDLIDPSENPIGDNCFDTAIFNRDVNSGFPGGALRTVRGPNGELALQNGELFTQRRPSPGCGHTFMVPTDENGNPIQAGVGQFRVNGPGRGADDPTVKFANRWGIPNANGRDCGMSFNYLLDYQGEIPGFIHGYTRFEFDINDDVTVWTDLMFGAREFNTRNLTTPAVNQLDPLRVVGDNPGSPYRAFADQNFNGIYDPDTDQFLFAQDNCNFSDCSSGDGLPDRGVDGNGDGIADDVDGDGLPDAAPAAQAQWGQPVVLAGTPGGDADGDGIEDRFDADAGIAFNNDVTLDRWSGFSYGHLQSLPEWAEPWAERDREEKNIRFGTGVEFTIPDTTWEGEGSFIWGERTQDYAFAWGSVTNASFGNVLERINCVRNDDGVTPRGTPTDCVQFNPFITSQFPVVDYVPQNEITPRFIPDPDNPGEMIENPAFNTEEEVAGVYVENQDLFTQNLQLYDLVLTGSPFQLPFTPAPFGVAFGAQLRIEDEFFRPSILNEQSTNIHGTGIARRDSQEKALDAFAELILPLMDSRFGYLEAQIAARHTDVEYEAEIGNTTADPQFSAFVPKYGLLYQPTDWVSLRASYGEGFVTPSQGQVLADSREADRNGRDPTCRVLEQDLDLFLPEGSGCTYDFDADGNPVDTAFEEVVDVIGSNPDLGPQTSTAKAAGVSFRLLQGDLSIDIDYVDIEFLDEIRNVTQATRRTLEQIAFRNFIDNACGASPSETCAVQAREDYILTAEHPSVTREGQFGPWRRHQGGPTNTTGRFVTAYDLKTRYRFNASQLPFIGGSYGQFVATLNGTFFETFEFFPSVDSDIVDGAGQRNDIHGRPPIPDFRLNGGLRWLYGNHTTRLSFTYHSGVDDLSATGSIRFENPRGEIDAQLVSSLFYQYRLDLFGGSPTFLSVNISNLANDRPDPLVDSSGIDSILMGTSPLGRLITFRVEQEL